MRFIESLSLYIERPPLSWAYRILLGYSLFPFVQRLDGHEPSTHLLIGWLVCALFMLRLGPAVVRHVIRFSADAQEHWRKQRQLAKRYDSYQWRKLFWIGAGMAIHAFVLQSKHAGLTGLAAFCLITGALGMLVWVKSCPRTETVSTDKVPQRA